jgi:hypothetical protein
MSELTCEGLLRPVAFCTECCSDFEVIETDKLHKVIKQFLHQSNANRTSLIPTLHCLSQLSQAVVVKRLSSMQTLLVKHR